MLNIILILICLLVGCVGTPEPLGETNNTAAPGIVQINIRTGVTNKIRVLQNLGSPNFVEFDPFREWSVWVYLIEAQISESPTKPGYWTISMPKKAAPPSATETIFKTKKLYISISDHNVVKEISYLEFD